MVSDTLGPPGQTNPTTDDRLPDAAESLLPRFGTLPYTAYHATVAASALLINASDRRNLVPTLLTAQIDIRPHQVDAVIAAIQSPIARGFMLADETGLGKTIEGGTVMAQFWAERRRAILLIVPATIGDQWQAELSTKFGLKSDLLDGPGVDFAVGRHGTLLGGEPRIVIISYGVASSKAHILAATPWDLVVIDEAHRLRNVYKAGPDSHSRRIREALRGRRKLLLTATPLQNSLMELHGLLSFIDEDLVCDPKDFALLYVRNPRVDQLARLAEIVRPVVQRHLRSTVQESGHVAFTRRIASTYQFEPYEDGQRLYDLVSAYLMREDTVAFGMPPNPLVLTVARKLLASSPAAIVGFLRTVLARLRLAQPMDVDSLDDAEDMMAVVQDARDLADARGETDDFLESAAPRKNSQAESPFSALVDEIAEIEGYIATGEAILADAKAERLVEVLPDILDGVCARGGRRLAVIFTESRKTQSFLVRRLSESNVKKIIITLNGSNDDAESSRLLFEWLAQHARNGFLDGSRSSGVKAAIIDTFVNSEGALLIWTESGGEGVNLQACSVVINYDLPWNPQRLEQRIGRCHRFGQEIDVLVINLQNKRNKVEERLIDLLIHKFKIFEGVFGASNDVLGAIEADVDLSAEVFRSLQTCRSDDEVDRDFAALARRLEASIKSERAAARRKIFDVLDESVVERLHARNRETAVLVDDFTRRLAIVIRAEMPDATFDDAVPLTFDLDGTTWTTQWNHAERSGARHLKLGEGQWADVVDRAASRALPVAAVRFDLGAMRVAGFPRFSNVERFVGRSGWMSVSRLTFETKAETIPRAALVLAGLTDDGEILDGETALRLFQVPGKVVDLGGSPIPASRLSEIERTEQARLTEVAKAEGAGWRVAEIEKLDRKVHDTTRAAELRAKELADKAQWMRRRMRANSDLSQEERLEELRKIHKVEKESGDITIGLMPMIGELRHQIDRKFDEIEADLKIRPIMTVLFKIRWKL